MSRQNEITEPTPLLDGDGRLVNPGYCKRNLFIYNRENIGAPRCRIKEWDFYQVGNENYMLQLCFANISIGSAGTATLVDLKSGETFSCMGLALFTKNRFQMPRNGDEPYLFSFKKGGIELSFEAREDCRILKFAGRSKGKSFDGEIRLDHAGEHESITIATPFKKEGRFFLTQKLNCMPAEGYVNAGGRKIEFKPDNSFGVLDWGRGVWPHKNLWYWANGSTYIDGKRFGFEITFGFGDESNATETALFYDGRCHKIGRVSVSDPRGKWLEPWVFTSEDGRFEMTMTPFYDNATGVKVLGIVGARCHQVHGKWNGKAVLDDGTEIIVKDMYAFCERMENLW